MPDLPGFLSSSWWWSQIATTLVLPPASLLLVLAWSAWRWNARPRAARFVATCSTLALWALATPWVGLELIGLVIDTAPFETTQLAQLDADERPQAIVVLGGGRVFGARDVGGEDVASRTLYRIRYAARLHRETQLPIAVFGGKPEGGDRAEAELMRDALDRDFGVAVRYVEAASETTDENARLGAALLKRDGITRVLLVTDAWHMRRARLAMREAGLVALPAPMGFAQGAPSDPKQWLPGADGLAWSRIALREMAGRLWYQARWSITHFHSP